MSSGFLFALSILVQSCIKKEPLNAECDIVSVTLSGDKLNREPQIFNDKVILIVKNDVSVSNLAPEFTLTPGATISLKVALQGILFFRSSTSSLLRMGNGKKHTLWKSDAIIRSIFTMNSKTLEL